MKGLTRTLLFVLAGPALFGALSARVPNPPQLTLTRTAPDSVTALQTFGDMPSSWTADVVYSAQVMRSCGAKLDGALSEVIALTDIDPSRPPAVTLHPSAAHVKIWADVTAYPDNALPLHLSYGECVPEVK